MLEVFLFRGRRPLRKRWLLQGAGPCPEERLGAFAKTNLGRGANQGLTQDETAVTDGTSCPRRHVVAPVQPWPLFSPSPQPLKSSTRDPYLKAEETEACGGR